MSKPTVPDLKELFKQAAEIAAQVPENMQEAAFNRAIDLLTHGIVAREPVSPRQNISNKSSKGKATPKQPNSPSESPLSGLLSAIDSTKHPGIISASKVLDRSLMLLQIARNDHDVDGLTPPEISKILTDKFRVRTTPNAVSMALGNATNLVNRTQEGSGYRYQIMSPGEQYLAHPQKEESKVHSPKSRKRSKKPISKDSKPRKSAAKKITSIGESNSPTRKSRSSGTGSFATVSDLLRDGFFSSPRTIRSVIDHCGTNLGFHFKANELSPALLRLLRDKKLKRAKNTDNQFEYESA